MMNNSKYIKIMLLGLVAFCEPILASDNGDVNSGQNSETITDSASSSNKLQKTKKVWHVPPMTYDATFKALFGGTVDVDKNKKFLMSFLNYIYGYDETTKITELEYLPTENSGTSPKGKLIYDIRCRCTLSDRNKTQFIVEMQRAKQKSYIDRILLGSSAITTDGFRASLSESSNASSSHTAVFRDNVPNIRHLSVLLDDYDENLGSIFHIALTKMNATLTKGNINDKSIELPKSDRIASDKILYTLIQLRQYVKLMEEQSAVKLEEADVKPRVKKSEWLDLLSVELKGEKEEDTGDLITYKIPEAEDEIVNEAMEFMQDYTNDNTDRLIKAMAEEDGQKIEYLKKQADDAEARAKEAEARAKEAEARAKEAEARAKEAEARAIKEKVRADDLARSLQELNRKISDDMEDELQKLRPQTKKQANMHVDNDGK